MLMLGCVCSLLWLSGTRPVGTQVDDVAFVNVNVVPMDRERIVAAQTVWISGGRIKAMV
jgi:hypothetical protein